ncbi:PAS domain S-box protein [Hwanghaeella sp.]|uniref:PAS domain S-box protein n=1 Tax=Hwanghaeella sp. TaxID=2605943 RepID=UPI003CCC0D5F
MSATSALSRPLARAPDRKAVSVRRRLLFAIVGAPLALASIFFVDVFFRQQSNALDQAVKRAQGLALTLVTNSTDRLFNLENLPRSLAEYPGLEAAAILSPKGLILAHSEPERIAEFVSDPLLTETAALRNVQNQVVQGDTTITVLRPILSGTKHVGWAKVVISKRELENEFIKSLEIAALYALLVIGGGIAYGVSVTGGLSRRLAHMVDVTNAFRAGDSSARILADRPDELGELGAAFNALADTVKNRETELQMHKDHLEKIVRERTRDLENEVADRKLAQEELTRSEEQVRQIVNSAGDGIVALDQSGKIVIFNTSAQTMFGYSPIEVMGQNVKCLMPMSAAANHDSFIAKFATQDKSYTLGDSRRIYGKRKNGDEFPIEVTVSTMFIGEDRLFTAIVRDITERIAAEDRQQEILRQLNKSTKELQESEGRLRHLLDSSPAGISVKRIGSGERLYGNDRFLEMFAIESSADLDAFGVRNSYVSEEDWQLVEGSIEAGKPLSNVVMERRRVNGEHWWVQLDAIPLNFEGEPSIVIWHHDMTDRIAAEDRQKSMLKQLNDSTKELQKSEERLRLLFDSSPVGIVAISVDSGQRLYANSRLLEMFGVDTIDELNEYGFVDTFVSREDFETTRKFVKTGTAFKRFVMERKKVSGERWWALLEAVPTTFMGEKAIIVWHNDITEQKKADAELSSLMESSPVGVSIIGEKIGERTYANKQYLRLFGAETLEELTAYGYPNTFVSPEDYKSARQHFETGVGADSSVMERRKINGETWWAKIFAVPIEFRGQKTFIIWCADITDQKQAEAELVQSEKLASLGGLVAGVAHEVNTPIGISVTAISHLHERCADLNDRFASARMKKSDLVSFLETADQSCGIVSSNLKRAADLVRSFKQVAVDQSSDDARSFRLREYLEEVMRSLHPQLKMNTGISVTIEGDEMLELESYPGPFAQVLTNLVMNSIIHAFPDNAPGEIKVGVDKDGDEARVIYTDTGKGIPPENVKRIFDPFFTTNRGAGGSGLGMHIVYNLITQKLGGSIECESKPGQGVSFEIRVPLRCGGTS